MENIVVSAKSFNGYYVDFPYGSHLSFVTTTYKALLDGLKNIKHSYKPTIYAIDTYGKPKFRKLTGVQLKTVFLEAGLIKK